MLSCKEGKNKAYKWVKEEREWEHRVNEKYKEGYLTPTAFWEAVLITIIPEVPSNI